MGTGDSDVKYARDGNDGAVADHVPALSISTRGWTPPPGGEYWPTAMQVPGDGHETAERLTSAPPAGTGRFCTVHVVPDKVSAKGIAPPPRDNEGTPTGAYVPTATHDVSDVQATAGALCNVPGGPGAADGSTDVVHDAEAEADGTLTH
jgi:hypothetical protein